MFLELYERGFNDREIAKKFGLTSQSIWYWRKEYGLPPKESINHQGKNRKIIASIQIADFMEMFIMLVLIKIMSYFKPQERKQRKNYIFISYSLQRGDPDVSIR